MAMMQQILRKLGYFLQIILRSKDLAVVAFLLCILVIIIVPLPPVILDFLLTISMMLSILIIFIALYIHKPTDFSAFPTLLLIVTLFRLALNVATTRMILTEGYRGPSAVSDIITAFGEFTISGNYVIGVIIFSILVLVNLLVVTNGSTRVTEVRARFALDAMPGKQMAIDADFNSGLIDEKEAKSRRQALSQEADFYGSMDGASKFVKGDAIASIVITVINIIGGFFIGMLQYDMGFALAAETFTILTIGDGLVGQIPALIIATATGIVATRTAAQEESKESFAQNLVSQLTSQSKTLVIVGMILLIFASIPGLPTLSLLFVGSVLLAVAWLLSREDKQSLLSILLQWINKRFRTNFTAPPPSPTNDTPQTHTPKPEKTPEEIRKEEEQSLRDALKVDFLELELGFELIGLADQKQGGLLIERVRSMRKKIAHDYGFLIPQIRIRDNLMLPSPNYEVKLKGVVIGEGMVMPTKFLALETGVIVGEKIEGVEVKEPAFGLNAVWIDPKEKEDAIIAGYTVFDPSSVISTHISELVTRHAHEFITRDEVNSILERMRDDYPALIDEARKITATIRMVLQALLAERVPIRDMLTILETTIDYKAMEADVDVIVEKVRAKLARAITQVFSDADGVLKILGFAPLDEEYLKARLKTDPNYGDVLALTPEESEKFTQGLKNAIESTKERNIFCVIATSDVKLRRVLVREVHEMRAKIPVLSYAEIDPHATFEQVGLISPNFA